MAQQFSFKKGYESLTIGDAKEAKMRIMEALNIKNRMSWSQRLNGIYEPRISEYNAITEIFKSYGITDIWGE